MSETTLPARQEGMMIRNSGVALSVGVVGVLLLMIIPLHPVILDLFLVFNLGLALVIIFVSMYTLRPMEFSVFPSVLLVVTLFRLSLNVAATRLILLHGGDGAGAAGQVIKSIGDFVVGGSYTVGIIVFIILVVINFVVITKGSGRVAEVAARFTLDAMPGKQMSIDADLNAGLIDEKEARKRRSAIASEADFYGAMDGASKFVRGDAIAAILIIIVNIVGGLVIGIFQKGMNLADAAQNFTLLTVGEGLVAQFPGLIISTAAGIVMTRAASESNLGNDVSRQFMLHPQAIYAAAGIIFFLGMIPGFPHLAFLILSAVLGVSGYVAEQARKREKTAVPAVTEPVAGRNPADAQDSFAPLDLMELNIGYALIGLVDEARGGELLKRITALRKQLATELGFVVPPIHIRDNLQIKPNEYQILIKGIEVAGGELMPGHFLAMNPSGGEKSLTGIPTKEPCFGLPAVWVTGAERERAQFSGYTVVDPPSVIATHLTEIVRSHAQELLGRQEVQQLLDQIGKQSPKLVEELVPHLMTVGAVTRVLGNLLRERIPIRDLRTILETLADFSVNQKDTDQLTEYARQALSRTITHQFQTPARTLNVIGIDPRIDQRIGTGHAQNGNGASSVLDPAWIQKLIGRVRQASERMALRSEQPVLLCSPAARPHLKKLIERVLPALPVLSTAEIAPHVRITALENVKVPDED